MKTYIESTVSANNHTDTDTDKAQGAVLHSDGHPADTALLEWWTTTDLYVILSAILDLLLWAASFSPTKFLCAMLGHGFDPEGSRLPEWPPSKAAAEIKTLDVEEIDGVEEVIGGFAMGYNGQLVYSESVSKAQARAEKQAGSQQAEEYWAKLTDAEWEAMKNYTPPLLNVALARKIKTYLQQGKGDYESAVLAGCKQSYARHHRLAFQRAAKNT